MASTIQIKRGTGSAVPSGLADGELAINLDNGQLYFGSGSTSVNSFRFTNLTADNYIVSSSVTNITTQTLSGSTEFGNSADDTHQFTGHITASGNISASGIILASNYRVDEMHALGTSDSATTLNVGPAAEFTKIVLGKGNSTNLSIFTNGNITASGNISSSGTITANSIIGTVGTATQGTIDHDSLANFVANEHIDHSGVSVIAGTGLTGGGTIAANRTLNVIGGTGVTANANDIAIGQDVATTANVLFNHITASGNISASLNSKLYASSASFGGAAFLRSFNVKGAGLEGRLSLQGASTSDNPGIEMTVNDNTSRVLMRLNPIGSNGTELSIFTEPDGGSIAEAITVESDGNLELNSHDIKGVSNITSSGNISASGTITADKVVSDNIQAGWHGSTTRIKILVSDFIPDDVGRPAMIDDTGSDRWLESHGTAKLFASLPIPTGFKATHVRIYGSATSALEVSEMDIDSKSVTSKGTGNIGTELNITDVTSTATNYLLLELAQASGEEVYGGYVTIAAV